MNVIIICSDTFRYDHLGFLKLQPVHTPHLDQLAAESACFTDYHLCSFPTLVNRIEVFTGRYAFPKFNWGQLPQQHPVMAQVFKHAGYTTSLFADNMHLMHRGWEFGRGFDFVKDIPGQMHDEFRPATDPMVDLPCSPEKLDVSGYRMDRYRRNAHWYRQQGTTTTSALFSAAVDWLDQPRDKFFMWIDAFDPHEPWDAAPEFQKLYPWDEKAEKIFWPKVGFSKKFTEGELDNIRSLYRSEVSQIDHWVGAVLAKLRAKQLLDNTAVIFCSDHGYYLAEHGLLGKPTLRRMPHPTLFYEELAHPPLLIRHPNGVAKGTMIPGLCQPADLFPTALELAGLTRGNWLQGHSLVPRLTGSPSQQHRAVGGSYPIKKDLVACLAYWTDEWCLMYNPLRGLAGSELYNRLEDAAQEKNVIASQPAIAQDLYNQLLAWLDEQELPRSRKNQLLFNKDFPRFPLLSYKFTMWKARMNYRRHYRKYPL